MDAARACTLTLVDAYSPGWIVEVDGGGEVPIADASGLRAVAVPAGTSTVTFTYAPAGVRHGAWLSLASLLCLLGGVGWVRRRVPPGNRE